MKKITKSIEVTGEVREATDTLYSLLVTGLFIVTVVYRIWLMTL